ncbi:MAG: NAD-binding protein [Thermoleophilia bacterium]
MTAAARAWSRHRWAVIAVAVVTTVTLGLVGYDGRWQDRVFASLRLLAGAFDANLAPEPTPPLLDIARFLGLAVSLIVVATTVAAVLARRTEELRASASRGHVVVCGAGDLGSALVRGFAASGRRVVVVERDPIAAEALSRLGPGVLAVMGDAGDPATLRRAAAHRARTVVCACGTDTQNLRAAEAAGAVGTGRGPRPALLVAVEDPEISMLFRRPGLEVRGAPVELFSVYERAARTLLAPPGEPDPARDLLLIGDGRLAQALVVRAARGAGHGARGPDGHPPLITVAGPHATRVARALCDRAPFIREACALEPADVDPPSATEMLRDLAGRHDAVVICLADESDGLKVAAALADTGTPILLRGPDGGRGLHDLMPPHLAAAVRPFTVVGAASSGLAAGQTVVEQLAEAVHELHRRGTPGEPSWELAAERLKESSREHARAMERHLRAAGLGIGSQVALASQRRLSPTEVDALAELEHERWRAARHPGAGASRFDRPWALLDDDGRETTRRLVRGWPAVLESAGLQLEELAAADPTPPRPGRNR